MEESETWAEWDLTGLHVTQLRLDYAFTVHFWTLERDFLLRLATPFTYCSGSGESVTIDPQHPDTVIPALAVLHQAAESFRASSLGRCVLRLTDGSEIASEAHPKYEAWESQGSGTLETASLLSTIGPGSPWGAGSPPNRAAV